MAEMMKSHNYTARAAIFPGYVSRKFDGVPGCYTKASLLSRQGKPLPGVQWIHDMISPLIPEGWEIWGEHWEPHKPFKYISGKVRKNEPYRECYLVLHNLNVNEQLTFKERYFDLLYKWYDSQYNKLSPIIMLADQLYVEDEIDMHKAFEYFRTKTKTYKDLFEGCMYHSAGGYYQSGKRSWNSLKLVKKPTVDLQVIGVLEAISETGERKGMVGSLRCIDANDIAYIVSAGKATHEERKKWWVNQEMIIGKIVTVQHKGDGFYEGLREPTFQSIHADKLVPDYVSETMYME